MNYTEIYKKRNLLSDGSTNTKLAKNEMKTYGLSLLPHKLNAKQENLCVFSTKECRELCLNMAGRAGFTRIQEARYQKTNYFVENKKEFINKLYGELLKINTKNEKSLVRLNVVSDVDWQKEFINQEFNLGDFNNITFYDYSKDHNQVINNKLANKHFTFSYSGSNWNWCEKFLQEKLANVAIVFKGKIPETYKGFQVVNGDLSDERVLDQKGVIVGLKYKIPRGVKYKPNKFVVEM